MGMSYKTEDDKKTFYRSKDWKSLRNQALVRDNFECQECKRQGFVTIDSIKREGKRKNIVLNVHHIKEIEDYPELALELDNLETLCVYHHNKTHGKGFKIKRKKIISEEKW